MGVPPETAEEVVQLLIEHCVVGHTFLKLDFLFTRGQLPIEKKVAYFHKVGIFRQLIDGITAIQQNTLFPVDVGDFGFAATRGGIAGIVGETIGLCVETANIDDVRSD